jgi:hypothetical protein
MQATRYKTKRTVSHHQNGNLNLENWSCMPIQLCIYFSLGPQFNSYAHEHNEHNEEREGGREEKEYHDWKN